MDKVNVLMSTYNGEKFLRDQIESVLQQKGVEVNILIRDDGSTDSTLEILESYADKHNNIKYYTGANLGPTGSFLDLIYKSDDFDYYAFCDQDDVWDQDKLNIALSYLTKLKKENPNTYYSNLRIVDEELNYYRNSHSAKKKFVHSSKYSCFIENLATGCTMVFNRAARDKIKDHPPQKIYMHDAYLYMVCKVFGTAVYDFEPHINYRQHSDNVVGTYLKRVRLQDILKRALRPFRSDFQPRYTATLSFYKAFENELSEEDKEKINIVLKYKDSFIKKLRLMCDRDFKPSTFLRGCRIDLLILKGLL